MNIGWAVHSRLSINLRTLRLELSLQHEYWHYLLPTVPALAVRNIDQV